MSAVNVIYQIAPEIQSNESLCALYLRLRERWEGLGANNALMPYARGLQAYCNAHQQYLFIHLFNASLRLVVRSCMRKSFA